MGAKCDNRTLLVDVRSCKATAESAVDSHIEINDLEGRRSGVGRKLQQV